MRHPSRGAVPGYLVLLIAGLALGAVAGYLLSTRFSGGATTAPPAAVVQPAGPDTAVHRVATVAGVESSRENAIVRAAREVEPCVVGIIVTQIQVIQSPYYVDEFFDQFFGPRSAPGIRQVENMGSGFVIRNDGLILTNYHVIEGARKLFVNFSDGRQFEGKIVGVDQQTDIAVVSVGTTGFKAIKEGNSDDLMTGEWAIAIGNPFLNFFNDAQPTVTVGVVSALDRNFAPSEGVYYQGMIQTDAAINPGNSGGPLVNALGEVIGINTFIFTGSGENHGSIGIGFAIPINRAARVANEIIQYGHKRQVWTGISVQDLTPAVATAMGFDRTSGVVVVDVHAGSPGERAGLRRNDIILRMKNRVIQSSADIEGFFLDYFVDDQVPIRYRRNGKDLTTTLTLKEYPFAH